MSDKDNKPPTAQEISNACESNKHNRQGKVGSAETSSCGLVKLKAYYEDRWKTPMAGATFDLYVNGKKVLSKARLAGYDHPEWEPGTFVYEVPEQGQVNFVITSEFTEAEIKSLKASIRTTLGQPYKNLVQQMQPYQKEWAENRTLAFGSAALKGAGDALSDAGDSIGDMFTLTFWKEIGSDIKDFSVETYHAAGETMDELGTAIDETLEEIDRTGFSSWVDKEINEVEQQINELGETLATTKEELLDFAHDVKVIIKYRNQIMNLPSLILKGKVDDVESFIDTVVQQIDPETYKEIIDSEEWQSTIELIYDGEAIGLPLLYLSEMLKVVPLNFYAEKFSYLGITIIVEIVLFIILALLGGVGAMARLVALIARIKNIADKGEKGAAALRAFIAMLEAFVKVVSKIKSTAKKLTASRRGATEKGATAGTIHSPRRNNDRRKECPLGSTFKKAKLTYGEEEIIGG